MLASEDGRQALEPLLLPTGREKDKEVPFNVPYSKQSILRILWTSIFSFTPDIAQMKRTAQRHRDLRLFAVHTVPYLLAPEGDKAGISLFFAIWRERFPHQTVPGEGF